MLQYLFRSLVKSGIVTSNQHFLCKSHNIGRLCQTPRLVRPANFAQNFKNNHKFFSRAHHVVPVAPPPVCTSSTINDAPCYICKETRNIIRPRLERFLLWRVTFLAMLCTPLKKFGEAWLSPNNEVNYCKHPAIIVALKKTFGTQNFGELFGSVSQKLTAFTKPVHESSFCPRTSFSLDGFYDDRCNRLTCLRRLFHLLFHLYTKYPSSIIL